MKAQRWILGIGTAEMLAVTFYGGWTAQMGPLIVGAVYAMVFAGLTWLFW